jgi:dTDP-glucose 4,6-dehydratase
LVADIDPRRILVTGGAGFIGSSYARLLLSSSLADEVRVLDKLTYSSSKASLQELEADARFRFFHGDICDEAAVAEAIDGCDAVVNFAAETHVDRSLMDPAEFIKTNIQGTWVLLEAVRQREGTRFVQVSTDEVYGAVLEGASREADRLYPRNPYSASKAGAEMMVISYVETHGVDAVITRGCNTYGPFQHPEKFIPLMITNVLQGRTIPVYGDGLQVRHWIHVEDHCHGIDTALRRGRSGEIYNVGGDEERTNLSVARLVVELLEAPTELITHVTDRKGHDRRYALSSDKLRSLGWNPTWSFESGIESTVAWYRDNRKWWSNARDDEYEQYYKTNYSERRDLDNAESNEG